MVDMDEWRAIDYQARLEKEFKARENLIKLGTS